MSEEKAIEIAKKVLEHEEIDDDFTDVKAVQRGNTPVYDVNFIKSSEDGNQNSYTTVRVEVN